MRGAESTSEAGPWRLVHVVRRRMPNRRLRLLGAAVLAFLVLAFVIVWTTPLFEVKRIEVTGTSVLDPAEVAALGEEAVGRSVLGADLDAIANAVAALAPVKSVDVARDWPDAVSVAVTERDPYMAVPSGDETFLMVDSEGVVFDETADPPGSIWRVELEEPGPDDLATIETLAVLQSLPSDLANEVEHVESPSPAGVTLHLEGGRTLRWGDGSESEQKAEVADRLLASGYEHVDVSAPDAPTVS
ncbi:FtsQ-type POTRA domain-containing protein [Glycomyces sp. TRM65418]|uniref:cell division protein FtsQ/DivIB n=1 Tax=Glycomyces sp. TRM65418 TaxID=2867006 RepID=UPI001CE516EB|nr:FtsQ-type POTRA domain-containing protein [Glycomyces sp. TRM65418]MCC3762072.1 FtsQ-type POTRA domain-containing protein [Glycomyces sp. TRM65418]QZD56142.1 FtsQ-type POTRA domain-containing protein [Glycomyces sp. TRM65418]